MLRFSGLLGRLLFLLRLQTGVTASGELGLKLLDTTSRVDIFQLARVEGVANAANVDPQFGSSAASIEGIPATTGYLRILLFGVNAGLHSRKSLSLRCLRRPASVADIKPQILPSWLHAHKGDRAKGAPVQGVRGLGNSRTRRSREGCPIRAYLNSGVSAAHTGELFSAEESWPI